MGFGVEGDITKLYNNYIKTHPDCCVLNSDAVYLKMKEEGVITQEQYNSGLIFDFKTQTESEDWKSKFGLQTNSQNEEIQQSNNQHTTKTNSNKKDNQDNYKLIDTKYNENNEVECKFYENKKDNDIKTVTYFNNIPICETSRLEGNIRYIKNDLYNFLKKNVTKENIDNFLELYGTKQFLEDIFFNEKLDIKTKNEIYNNVINMANDKNRQTLGYKRFYIPNGDFEGEFYQGKKGDCVIIGRLAAILSRPNGKERLKEHISIDNNMNVTVNFSGINKKVTVTYDELRDKKYAKFSTGNADVKVLEIAWQKLTKYIGGVNNPLSNMAFDTALLGKSSVSAPPNIIHLIPGPHLLTTNYYKKEFNNPNKAFVIGLNALNFVFGIGVKTINEKGHEEQIQSAHQFAVVKSDENYVYLIDPEYSGEILKLKWNDFNRLSFIINEINLK